MKRNPDFVMPMQGEREVLEIYGWPLPQPNPSPIKLDRRLKMDHETIQILLDLLNPLHGSIDKQVMIQVTDERELDAPSDRDYDVTVTVRQERDLTQAIMILESRLRDPSPPVGG